MTQFQTTFRFKISFAKLQNTCDAFSGLHWSQKENDKINNSVKSEMFYVGALLCSPPALNTSNSLYNVSK